ncbi:MAG: hypothetical protein ACI8TX_000962 [Hyphomicrobiaceae bacterium]|jgi:hypothetical protein
MSPAVTARQGCNPRFPRTGQPANQGAALVAAVLVVAALAMTSMAASRSVIALAQESRARVEVACARFAALSGVILPAPGLGSSVADWIPGATRLDVSAQIRDGVCLVTAHARCGAASRTFVRQAEDLSACTPPP